MSKQPSRGSVYAMASASASMLEILLQMEDYAMIKDGIRTVIKFLKAESIPISKRNKKTKQPVKTID